MKFSIIVPVYNVEKYLDKCLKSLSEQSYSNFDVIVVNDGSSDNSQNIIDKYVNNNHRFKSFTKKNGGLSDARNFGLNYVSGDYILFVDGDDYLDKDLLSKLNQILIGDPVDIVRFNCLLEDDNGVKLSEESYVDYKNKKMEDAIKELITRQFVEAAFTVIRLHFGRNMILNLMLVDFMKIMVSFHLFYIMLIQYRV